MRPTTVPKLVATAVAAAMLASLLYVTQITRQDAEGSAPELRDCRTQYHLRVQQAISETEKDMTGRR